MFEDRSDAGRILADRLAALDLHDPVVYALPRGGVPVATRIAERLHAPLDLLFVGGSGAGRSARRESADLERGRIRYRGARPPVPATGRISVVVDDGIATGPRSGRRWRSFGVRGPPWRWSRSLSHRPGSSPSLRR